ncbi:MAG TPA: Rid family hydrolase [Solirubrobacteraceae bacterium]|jgi:enamine deaminase RidA (YjgF/YER057c/UK114 family)|nr:Rid family hydrolase [Solirubrobacteraceae bacterium]
MSGEVQRFGGDPPSPWEERYGYSRAVIVGGLIHVGGTTAVGPLGAIVGESAYEQMAECLRKVLHELARLGAAAEDLVAVRAYVTDISRHEEISRAFKDALRDARPLFTMVQVAALIDPRMSVEIEVSAVAPTPAG